MKTITVAIAAALAAPALAVPQNPWKVAPHRAGFMPKDYTVNGWKGWGAGWSHATQYGTGWSSTSPPQTSSVTSSPVTSSLPPTIASSPTLSPSYITYTVLSTDTMTITACPSSVTDCLEEQKTTFTSCTTYPASVTTDTVYVTITDVVTSDIVYTVTNELDSTVVVTDLITDTVTTSCTTGWAAWTTYTFDSDKTTATEFPTAPDTTRAVPSMSTSLAPPPPPFSSYVTSPTEASSSGPWIPSSIPTSLQSGPPSWTSSAWSSNSWTPTSSIASPTSTGLVPHISPGFEPACTRVPIPGCVPCEGQPGNDPNAWCGFDINTDYYESWPQTCMKVICKLTVDNVTITPDGVERLSMVINGKLNGDVIEAWWGDIVEVQTTNNLQSNGSSIHFHGLRQLNTNEMDGVPSITQCPIPGDGGSLTQTFVATQYGHTWIHSHYSIQAWEGVYAPFIIHGPTTWPYDYDLGAMMVADWLHTPVFEQFEYVERTGSPNQDNILINGVGIYSPTNSAPFTGQRAQLYFEPGKKHRIQLICNALDSSFAFSIDNHILTVIGMDFVPIHPYTTTVLKIGIGQRYDIIVEANQAVSDYWLRVDPLDFSVAPGQAPPCGASNEMANNTMAIVHYIGSPTLDATSSGIAVPETSPYPHNTVCEDEPYDLLVPWVPKLVGSVTDTVSKDLVITQNASTQIYRWYLSGSTFQVSYSQPTLLSIVQNSTDYAGPLAIEVTEPNTWTYVIIETPVALSHPIHLHGHDFYVLSAGEGSYTNQSLLLANPPRRDVATLPIGGYIVIGFLADNPGSWLMHCHIGWHVSMGFALQIIETPDLARATVTENGGFVEDNCDAWDAWDAITKVQEIDSGV